MSVVFVSGTALSRAWCAVSLASSDDEARPIPRIVGSEHLELHWPSNRVARWIVPDGRLNNRPHGVLMAVRPVNDDTATETSEGESSPAEQRLASL